MVVFYHCEGLFSLPKYWHWSGHLFYFGYSGVEYFFVLSGIVILHAHWSDIGAPARIGDYAWKRFRRIYPIYWIVLLAVVPLYFLVPSFGNGFEKEPAVLLDSFLLVAITRSVSILPVAWTLYHEIMFYMVFGFLLVRKQLGLAALGLWIAGSLFALLFPPHNELLGVYFSPLHLLFCFGLLVLIAVRRVSWPGVPFAIAGILGFIACCVYDDATRAGSPYLTLAYGAFAASAAMGFMLLEKRGRLVVPGFLTLLGDASYSLYLVHYMVLSAAAKVVYPLWLHHKTSLAVPFLALIVTALACGLAVHQWVERPLIRRLGTKRRSAVLAAEVRS